MTSQTSNIWTLSPCANNYHVPTQNEFQNAYNNFSGAGYSDPTSLPYILKMPYVGFRDRDGSLSSSEGSEGYYWTSSPSTKFAYNVNFASSYVNL